MRLQNLYDRFIPILRWSKKWLFKPALTLVAILVIVHSVLLFVWGRQLEKRVEQFHASGHPINLTELAPKPVPDDQNAAVVLQKAFILQKNIDSVTSRVDFDLFITPSRQTSERRSVEQQVRADITNKQSIFPLVRQAVTRPACVFPINWESGAAATFPHISSLRRIGRLIAAKAIIDAEDGRVNEALDDVALGIDLVQSTKDEPSLISFLSTSASTSAMTNSLQLATRTHPLTYEQAERMYRKLGNISLESSFIKAIDCEYPMMNWVFTTVRKDPNSVTALLNMQYNPKKAGPIKRSMVRVGHYLWRPVVYRDQIFCLDVWNRQIQVLPLTYREVKARKQLDVKDIPRWAVVSNILYPVFTRATASRDKATTNLQLGQVAMALKAYKAQHGTYPSSLNELKSKLGWKLPDDVFTSHPFTYQRRGEGFILYSWGPNLKDDGGYTVMELKQSDEFIHGDLVWTSEI